MKIGLVATLVLFVTQLVTLPRADLSKERAILDRDGDPARLEAAAVAIAVSNDAAAVNDLARHLGQRSFLRRLDPPQGSVTPVLHLGRVFRAMAEHPSPAIASLCVTLASDPDFNAEPSRLNFLLNALAAVRPMSAAAANIFSASGRSGYLEVNGPLLAQNASPNALKVLSELMADESLDRAQRVSVAHWALLPNRTNPAVAAMCARVLAMSGLSRDVEIAMLESLYDYQPGSWFGRVAGQPSPPPWSSAPATTRDVLRALAATKLRQPDLSPDLRAAMQKTLDQLR